jgi:hypothetical protein
MLYMSTIGDQSKRPRRYWPLIGSSEEQTRRDRLTRCIFILYVYVYIYIYIYIYHNNIDKDLHVYIKMVYVSIYK